MILLRIMNPFIMPSTHGTAVLSVLAGKYTGAD